jgi:hypothetical protein
MRHDHGARRGRRLPSLCQQVVYLPSQLLRVRGVEGSSDRGRAAARRGRDGGKKK